MWPIDRLRRRERGAPEANSDRRAIILETPVRSARVVSSCCERAHAAGVRRGMPVAHARALFETEDVRVLPARPDQDRAALRSLAVWAHRFSPVVALDDTCDEPDTLLLDVTGCARVFGDEWTLARAAHRELARLAVRARVAIAPSFGSAWAVARYGPNRVEVVEEGALRDALASIPMSALRLDEETVSSLAELGLERVEHVLDLPRSALPSRFGEAALHRLDQACGQAIETIVPVRPVPPPGIERVFDGPTDRVDAIELTVRELLGEIAEVLTARGCGACRIEIELVRSDLPPECLSIVMGRPSRDAKHLWSLIRPKLERACLGFGVEAVRVHAKSVRPLRHEQQEAAFNSGRASDVEIRRATEQLLDTLGNRLGVDRVLRARAVESHLPERAFVMEPASSRSPRGQAAVASKDRPTVLFDRPVPAEVVALTPDGPVHRVRWRHGEHAVIASIGPERIAGEWWRGPGSTRDYFKVRCEDGRWVWLARTVEGRRWFVHGVWA
ncbi:MAG: DNA polymerase Y family protein [Planctomycetota bacterium]